MATRGDVARSALSTYLGGNAGARVLSGQIKRGDGETIRAAIVVGDLRNSTAMAEQLGRQVYIDNLNAFFDATAGAVADAGGEILSFMGDGFLAIFPCGRNHRESSEACKLALSAAFEAEDRMAETNRARAERGEAALGYGLGLNIGNVTFGNVGLAERLTFSVFGSTVNEVSRLEQLTKKYRTPIVASAAFQEYCGGEWEKLGAEALHGVDQPIAVYRPGPHELKTTEARKVERSALRDLSQAESVVLLHRDSPAP
jgi:adenylate cyclase